MKSRLSLFQHSWSAKDYDPDGSTYATREEADAAEVDRARNQLGDDYEPEDLADAIAQHVKADEIGDGRIGDIRSGLRADDLTDAEAVMAAEELRGYDSAVYEIDMVIESESALRQIVGKVDGEDVSAAQLLQTGVMLARRVLAAWKSGDLAGAVNDLEEWTGDVTGAFPGLDYADPAAEDEPQPDPDLPRLCVLDIRPGDAVDLTGCEYASEETRALAEFELFEVISTERERADLIRLDFDGASIGFPTNAMLPVNRDIHPFRVILKTARAEEIVGYGDTRAGADALAAEQVAHTKPGETVEVIDYGPAEKES